MVKTKRSKREALLAIAVLGVLGFGIVSCDNRRADVGNNDDKDKTPHVQDRTVTSKPSMVEEEQEQRVDNRAVTHTEEQSIANQENLIKTVQVEGGTFMYGRDGSTIGANDRLITVDTFHMGQYLVTQAQWKEVMGENPSHFDGTNKYDSYSVEDVFIFVPATPTFNRDNLPVETVSWYDVLVFANKLSVKDGLQPAYKIKGSTDSAVWGAVPNGYDDKDWDDVEVVTGANGWRLPTEHQWEFAAKGGTKSKGYEGKETDTYFLYSGSNDDELDEFAVYDANSGYRTHEVGEKKANELGLYDMSGNVWEWCYEMYAEPGHYSSFRVSRGGGWGNSELDARSVRRGYAPPNYRYIGNGFRLVRP